jgi:low temperature requirement protein LtrA
MARDLFNFGHFPIVTGILAYAVVVKHMVADPKASLPYADRWLLITGFALLVGGCLQIQWQVIRRLAIERFVALAAIATWLLAGAALPGWAAVAGIAPILAAMQSITWRRYRGSELAQVSRVG